MFQGGGGGGSDEKQIRTRTILSLEDENREQEKEFFDLLKISSQSNSFLIEWNDKVVLQQIEIIDMLGRVQKSVSILAFQKASSFSFNGTRGVYFFQFRDNRGKLFRRKIIC